MANKVMSSSQTIATELIAIKEGLVLGLGNPLLDITATVDSQFLEKYGLKSNHQILADESQKNLCHELIERYEVKYSAGGSVQNSLRVMQWFFDKTSIATFMGCVGNDENRKRMESKAIENGLNVVYMVNKKEQTGTCVCLLTNDGNDRSLCAYLGASTEFNVKHLLDNYQYIEKSKYFLTSGYVLGTSFESILNVAQHYQKNSEKTFLFSLAAPFVVTKYKKQFLEIYPFIDYIFANESEAREFSKQMDWSEDDIYQIARLMAQKDCQKKKEGRRVIITQGSGPVVMAISKNNVQSLQEFETIKLDDKLVVDTTGAGDAFLGGFVAYLIRRQAIDDCVEAGIYAASQVIQHFGCNFPKENYFEVK